MSAWFVYLLECHDGTLYAGITTDVSARLAKHRSGKGAAYTRSHPPRRVLAAMPCPDRSTATRAELALKKCRRPEKLLWAEQWAWTGAPGAPAEGPSPMDAAPRTAA